MNASLREKRKTDWAELIPSIEFAMNATFQKSIGKSPAEVVFGKNIYRERWFGKDEFSKETQTTKGTISTRREFNIGDEVLVKVESRTKDKDRYEGPYTITDKVHERRYELQDERGKQIQRNVEKLKKFVKEGDVRVI
jgi:hypothetical protein